jgi:hypothetical protein
MEALKGLTERRWLVAGVALVLGIILGVFYGWVINPVDWTNAEPSQLRSDLQQEYLTMAIVSYSVNQDPELARERYDALGENASEILAAVGADPGSLDPSEIQQFSAAIELLEPAAEETGGSFLGGGLSRFVLPACGATGILGVLLVAALVIRRRMSGAPAASPLEERGDLWAQAGRAGAMDFSPTTSGNEPLATFRTTFTLGDDLYDDSFSIETPAGEFVGECGVGIADLIGTGEPKKVSAFEIWLFDKNDIQTVTKVLMSRYTFKDDSTRNRLASKGDPVEVESGGVIYLETASLEVEARIVDLTYGEGPLPGNSYFQRLTIELRAWPRGAGGS